MTTIHINLIDTNGAKTRVAILRNMKNLQAPATAYRIARDAALELNKVSPILKDLAREAIVECTGDHPPRYFLTPCLSHLEKHLPAIYNLVKELVEDNPHASPDQILQLLEYLLLLIDIEVEDDEAQDNEKHDDKSRESQVVPTSYPVDGNLT